MAKRKQTSSAYNIMAQALADRWQRIEKGDKEERKRTLQALDLLSVPKAIVKQIQQWEDNCLEVPYLSEREVKHLAALVEEAGLGQEVVERRKADRDAQVFVHERRRAIMNRAKRSIEAFEERCNKAGKLKKFPSFRETMLELGRETKGIYLEAVEMLPKRHPYSAGGTLSVVYEQNARECESQVTAILERLERDGWPSGGTTKLRQFFYEGAKPRKIVDRYPRLRRYPYKRPVVELFYFNIVNYFVHFMPKEELLGTPRKGKKRRSVYYAACLLADSLYFFLTKKNDNAAQRVRRFKSRWA